MNFPDIENYFTFGKTLEDALDSAKDVLKLCIYDLEEDNKNIPKSSVANDIILDDDGFISLIYEWMVPFSTNMINQSVKKTLTIPK